MAAPGGIAIAPMTTAMTKTPMTEGMTDRRTWMTLGMARKMKKEKPDRLGFNLSGWLQERD
jgi:hypothetical protein